MRKTFVGLSDGIEYLGSFLGLFKFSFSGVQTSELGARWVEAGDDEDPATVDVAASSDEISARVRFVPS